MIPALTIALTFATAALLIAGIVSFANDVYFRYRALLDERFDDLRGVRAKSALHASIFRMRTAKGEEAGDSRTNRLEQRLEQAGLSISVTQLTLIALCLATVLAISFVAVSQQWWLAPLGIAAGLVSPLAYINILRMMRMRRLIRQIPEAFDAIGRAVRAGQTVPSALRMVADDFASPIADEFRMCYEEQNLGMPNDIALRNLASRTGIMEMRILVIALLLQARTGGNLVELLENMSTMVRNRMKLERRMRALTGEGRIQAVVLIVLPIVAFAALLILSPEYVAALLERPRVLIATATAQLAGAIWIRHIIKVDF